MIECFEKNSMIEEEERQCKWRTSMNELQRDERK